MTIIPSGSWYGHYCRGFVVREPVTLTLEPDGTGLSGSGFDGEPGMAQCDFTVEGRVDASATVVLTKKYSKGSAVRWEGCWSPESGIEGSWSVRKEKGTFVLHPGQRSWLATEPGAKVLMEFEGVVTITGFGKQDARGQFVFLRDDFKSATHYVVRTAETSGVYVNRNTEKLRGLTSASQAQAMLEVLRAEACWDAQALRDRGLLVKQAKSEVFQVAVDPISNANVLRWLYSLPAEEAVMRMRVQMMERLVIGEICQVLGMDYPSTAAEMQQKYPQGAKGAVSPLRGADGQPMPSVRKRKNKAAPLPG